MYQNLLFEILNQGVPVGQVRGIRVRLHFTLLLMGLLFVFERGLIDGILYGLILFGSVLLHELGHCYGATLVGGFAHQIILWPLGGLAVLGDTNRDPRSELIVTALGPAVSVALAVIGWALLLLAGPLLGQAPLLYNAVGYVAVINTILAAFNLLFPLFPMDAARIVRSALSMKYSPGQVTYNLCTFGLWLGIGMAFFGFLGVRIFYLLDPTWMVLLGLFGAFACYQERMMLRFQDVYTNYYHDYSGDNSPMDTMRSVLDSIRSVKKRKKARARSKGPAQVIDMDEDPMDRLQREMSDAVAREDFQEAARIRDKIRRLQN